MRKGAACLATALVLFAASLHAATRDEEVRNGDVLQLLLPAIGWGLTFAYDDAEGRDQFYRSYFTTMGITYFLKVAAHDQRPNGGDFLTYVSGHTASAFAGAAFMQMRYGWWYGVPAYIAAIYTGWTRIDEENPSHFQDDVTRGAVIAIASTWYFTTRYGEPAAVAPVIAPGYFGVALHTEW